MTEHDELTARLEQRGLDVDAAESALRSLVIETPSWGYGDSGTRFGVFPQTGRRARPSSASTTPPRCIA